MVHVCCVPGCHSRSDREKQLSFYRLPLAKHHLLKKWASNIGRKDLPLNNNTRICSLHFESGKNKYSIEVPTFNLPKTPYHRNAHKQKSPKERLQMCEQKRSPKQKSVSVGTDLQWETRVAELEAKVVLLAVEWGKGACTFHGYYFAKWRQSAILYRVSFTEEFWNVLQIPWSFNFMSTVLGVSECPLGPIADISAQLA